MLIAILQLLLLPFAGYALFRIWRRVSSTGKGVALVVTGGFLIRAFLGQLLFWLSYLPVRFPPGAEDDNGMWFYAWDGRAYFLAASDASHQGWSAILHYPSDAAAAFYVKILATFVALFGSVATVGLLLNLFAYLGTCAAMLSLFPRDSRTTTFALAALSFYPSVILWSLQPLKDVFFLALVAAFVALAFAWQQLWKQTGDRYRLLRGLAIFAGVVVLLYGIAGIRWYFAAVFLASAIPFLLFATVRARSWMAALASVALFAGSVWAFYAGGGAYIPDFLLALVKSKKPAMAAKALPRTLIAGAVDIRSGFRNSHGNTDIVEPPKPVEKKPVEAKPVQPKPAATVAAKPRKQKPAPKPVIATTTEPMVAVADTAPTTTQPPAVETAATATTAVAETATTAPEPVAVATTTTTEPLQTATIAEPASPVQEPPVQIAEAAPPKPAPVKKPKKRAPAVAAVPPQTATTAPAPEPVAQTATTTPAPAPTPAPVTTSAQAGDGGALSAGEKGGSLALPLKQTLVGMSAMILPRFVGEGLGLYRIGSNSRMFLFAELDTLYFDAVLAFALIALFRSLRRGGWRSPALLLVVIATGAIAGMLAYTITNFGTLFRHRGMVFIGLVMIPLIVAGEIARRNSAPADGAAESAD
ncbi:MAG TPA: hypothetical protein VKB93_13300 [Thermoanaerobaculia bacterium]|nr:hypothetical protein [Thermoanaerobaculia bacterium]